MEFILRLNWGILRYRQGIALSLLFIGQWNWAQPLVGIVDMHTHPFAQIGFGSRVFHGAIDGDDIDKTLGESCCKTHHGLISMQAINQMESGQQAQSIHNQHNNYKNWAKYNDITHQHLWHEWLKRSWQHGLRVMVALTVNSRTLADACGGKKPTDDKTVADMQIDSMKAFVGRHDFMEIAYSAMDLRRIVGSGRLAIILGVEMDNIGNLHQVKNLTDTMVEAEIQRLFDKGVRYIFPIHVTDNVFGGTAIYEPFFNYANRRESGHYWDMVCTPKEDSIGFHFQPDKFPNNLPINLLKILKFGIFANPPQNPSKNTCLGLRNRRGLTPKGIIALKKMMQLGMMIDIDHASQQSVSDLMQLAWQANYPLNSGHNGLRGDSGNENGRTLRQMDTLSRLGGMFGVGWGNGNATSFTHYFGNVLHAMNGKNVALGTDINGLVVSPAPPKDTPIIYDATFQRCKTGQMTWDYNKEGVAHYGLLPDFLKHVEQLDGGAKVVQQLNQSAEHFAQMWEKCAAH
jgi:microsomal dipeptidase-like Zn-dependent dipeptidase